MRREQILDAMEPLVARQGWEHTTFVEICRAAGISNRVLTYHFKGKDDLLFAVFERVLAMLLAFLHADAAHAIVDESGNLEVAAG